MSLVGAAWAIIFEVTGDSALARDWCSELAELLPPGSTVDPWLAEPSALLDWLDRTPASPVALADRDA